MDSLSCSAMFESHTSLTPPPDETVLWRYMDFPKFMDIVMRRELYFSCLANLNDPFEGHITRPMVDLIRGTDPALDGEKRETNRQKIKQNLAAIRGFRQMINVSCWHMNETESDAMWQLYMPSGQGIAIRTTFGRFKDSVKQSAIQVHGGIVQYVDYNTHECDYSNIFNWSILKRKSYAHENEFRAIALEPTGDVYGAGLSVKIDATRLIQSVFVSPAAPAWHVDLLRSLTKTHNLDISINRSKLYRHPMYLDEDNTGNSTGPIAG